MKKQNILIYVIFLFIISFTFNWFSSQFFLILVMFYFIFFLLFVIFWIFLLRSAIRKESKVSIIILVLNLLILLFFPFSRIKLYLEFDWLKDDRTEIIEKIQNKDLKIYDSVGNIELPSNYKYISASGEVKEYKNDSEGTIIGFWIYRGLMISNKSEILLYSTMDKKFINDSGLILNIVKIEELEENWYYVTTN